LFWNVAPTFELSQTPPLQPLMEAKLYVFLLWQAHFSNSLPVHGRKTQRVADLRELLQKASVAIPAKANKADLIAKILASPAALAAFNNPGSSTVSAPKAKAPEPSQSGQDDDLVSVALLHKSPA
jgi:hypothetical protein